MNREIFPERHALSDAVIERRKEDALRCSLKEYGYELYKITHFRKHDRISFGNKNIKISLNLRSKISQITLETLVEACIGSDQFLSNEGKAR